MSNFCVRAIPTFQHTITVLNRRDGKGSPDRRDTWKKTVLDHCAWTQSRTQQAQGVEVSEGADYLIRVPPSTEYRPYSVWKGIWRASPSPLGITSSRAKSPMRSRRRLCRA